MKFKSYLLGILAIFSACQPFDVPLTHNTPYFTKGRQFEGGINAGIINANANLAFSPIKYLAVQANGYTYNLKSYSTRYYANYVEAAAGLYLPYNKMVYGVNYGYGYGDSNWIGWQLGGSTTSSSLARARFDSRKQFFLFYIAHNVNNGDHKMFVGVSYKHNLVSYKYYSASTLTQELDVSQMGRISLASGELSVFLKTQLYRNLYADFYGGVSSSQQYIHYILRLGFSIKLGKRN